MNLFVCCLSARACVYMCVCVCVCVSRAVLDMVSLGSWNNSA